MRIRFLTITQSFLANQAQISYGNSGDYYLSINVEKSGLGPYFFNFLVSGPYSGPKKGVVLRSALRAPELKTEPKS